jgi:hypothetical protein
LGVFTLCAIFFKLTEVAQIFGQLFFPRFKSCIDFDKSCMGYILGDFIWNTSGHPCDIKSLLSDRCYKTVFRCTFQLLFTSVKDWVPPTPVHKGNTW